MTVAAAASVLGAASALLGSPAVALVAAGVGLLAVACGVRLGLVAVLCATVGGSFAVLLDDGPATPAAGRFDAPRPTIVVTGERQSRAPAPPAPDVTGDGSDTQTPSTTSSVPVSRESLDELACDDAAAILADAAGEPSRSGSILESSPVDGFELVVTPASMDHGLHGGEVMALFGPTGSITVIARDLGDSDAAHTAALEQQVVAVCELGFKFVGSTATWPIVHSSEMTQMQVAWSSGDLYFTATTATENPDPAELVDLLAAVIAATST